MQRAIIMSDAAVIEPVDLGSDAESGEEPWPEVLPPATTLREAKERIEQDYILAAMERHGGNIVKAADELGVSRPTLYDLMKKHGLTPVVP